jgi:hypothetical protein
MAGEDLEFRLRAECTNLPGRSLTESSQVPLPQRCPFLRDAPLRDAREAVGRPLPDESPPPDEREAWGVGIWSVELPSNAVSTLQADVSIRLSGLRSTRRVGRGVF